MVKVDNEITINFDLNIEYLARNVILPAWIFPKHLIFKMKNYHTRYTSFTFSLSVRIWDAHNIILIHINS